MKVYVGIMEYRGSDEEIFLNIFKDKEECVKDCVEGSGCRDFKRFDEGSSVILKYYDVEDGDEECSVCEKEIRDCYCELDDCYGEMVFDMKVIEREI